MQAVLDDYLIGYNAKWPHQGRGMYRRTHVQAFIDALQRSKLHSQNQLTKPPDPALLDVMFPGVETGGPSFVR